MVKQLTVNSIWENKKTKKFYELKGKVVNTTNAQDDQVMVLYSPLNTISEPDKFVREENEFLKKFELIVNEETA
jgi:hypothetical protein